MRLIRRTKFSEQIETTDAAWGIFFKLALDPVGRAYYRATNVDNLSDVSFALEHDDRIIALVECDTIGGAIGRFGFPIEARVDPTISYVLRRKATVEIVSELKRVSKEFDLPIRVRQTPALDPDGLLLSHLVANGAVLASELRTEMDLSQDETTLFNDLRKGHRQQVRWGEKNLSFSTVDRDNPDRSAFESYRSFHAEVAGRVTRGPQSWDAMFNAIASGRGDLVLGKLDGVLVSASVILDGGDTAYYASGVYHREHFDMPLAHAPLFRAALRAKARGRMRFDVGEVPLNGVTDKEMGIGFFKRGFSNRMVECLILTLSPCV